MTPWISGGRLLKKKLSFTLLVGLITMTAPVSLAKNINRARTNAGETGFTDLMIGPDFQVDTLTPPTPYDTSYHNIGSDRSGHVYYLWMEAIFANPSSHRLLFRSSSDFGASLDSDPVELPVTIPPYGISQIQMCNDQNGHVYVVWVHAKSLTGDRQLYFTRSSDYGRTWLAQDRRVDTATSEKGILYPVLSCDDQGHIYAVWIDTRSGFFHVYFNASSDYGDTWQSADAQVDHVYSRIDASLAQMGSDAYGHVYVTWMDRRSGAYRLYFNRSSDYGATWAPKDTRIDRIDTDQGSPMEGQKITCDDQGHVYIMWQDSRDPNRTHLYANRSSDYGVTWEAQDQAIDHEGIYAAPIAISSDNNGYVYAVWHGGNPQLGRPKVFFNYSSDYGASWSSIEQRLDSAPSSRQTSHVQIVSDDWGNLYAAWAEVPGLIYSNYSPNHGTSWLPQPVRLDSGPNNTGRDQPIIASDGNGHAYVAWYDSRNRITSYYALSIMASMECSLVETR